MVSSNVAEIAEAEIVASDSEEEEEDCSSTVNLERSLYEDLVIVDFPVMGLEDFVKNDISFTKDEDGQPVSAVFRIGIAPGWDRSIILVDQVEKYSKRLIDFRKKELGENGRLMRDLRSQFLDRNGNIDEKKTIDFNTLLVQFLSTGEIPPLLSDYFSDDAQMALYLGGVILSGHLDCPTENFWDPDREIKRRLILQGFGEDYPYLCVDLFKMDPDLVLKKVYDIAEKLRKSAVGARNSLLKNSSDGNRDIEMTIDEYRYLLFFSRLFTDFHSWDIGRE